MLRSWRLRLVLLLVALIGLGVLMTVLNRTRPEPEVESPGCPDCGSINETQASQRLTDRYAPIVQLRLQDRDCDKNGEGYRPVPVEIVLDNPDISLHKRDDRSFRKTAPGIADLLDSGTTGYLNLPGSPQSPGCTYERDGRRYATNQPSVTYAHIVFAISEPEDEDPEIDTLVLQYWFFYYLNDANNKHEGDWEMIQIVFEAASVKEALQKDPDRVGYSQHSGGEASLWTDKKLDKDGTHPIVFVAVGAQSNYFGPHVFLGRAEQGAGFGCDDASGPGGRIQLEARLIPDQRGRTDPFAWVDYRGRWGELAGPEFDGPTGPIMKRQWSNPLGWEEDLRSSSVRVPSRDTIGPNGVEAFCNLVHQASDILLPIYLQLGNLSLALVGVAGLGIVLSLTKTRYIPVQARPMRGRRRLGQILMSSLDIYLRNLRLMLGIGLAFVPISFLVSIAHWLVLRISPLDSVVNVPEAKNIAQDLVWAFALSEMEFGLTYAIVIAATTIALSNIERGIDLSVRDTYKLLLRKALTLLLPRAAAVAATVAMGLTIIGLPLALRYGVRWSFIEQAILLDGESPGSAPGTSSRVIGVDWWWTAATVFSLAAIGLFAAPFIAILILLFARSVPLSYVNFVSSFIYVALVPFIAIAFALVYFDLQARAEESVPLDGASVEEVT